MHFKKQQLEPCMEQLTGSGLRKDYDKAVYCHLVYLKLVDFLKEVNDTTLMAESEEELKSLLMRVKEKSERVSLKLKKKT